MQVQYPSNNVSKSQLFNNKTPQFISMNFVKHASDPRYILLKNLAVQIQCVLYWIQYNLMFFYFSDLSYLVVFTSTLPSWIALYVSQTNFPVEV